MASSFGGLAALVARLHMHLVRTTLGPLKLPFVGPDLPPNGSIEALCDGIATAHKAYGQALTEARLPLCVLFVVQDGERNIFDQKHLQQALEDRGIAVYRLPFSQTLELTRIDRGPRRPLVYTPPNWADRAFEVTVLYFRSTYSPTDFPNEAAWKARLQLERSGAIKCPSILTHLAGTKKVQQVLATPFSQHLERFLPDPADCAAVRETFAAMYPMDDSAAGREGRQLATSSKTCEKYVLKPQREGGGNNIYGRDIPAFLAGLGDEAKWRGYVLMERIEPPRQRNSVLREGRVMSGEVIAELGVFGTCLWRRHRGAEEQASEILLNGQAGYLLRTKGRDSNEGGVAAGFGAIDSVALVDV